MKKIPTIFQRIYKNHKVVGIENKLTDPSLKWVLDGEGVATEKIDGSCCAIIDGVFYRRYDAKKDKKAPDDAIPCCDPDPVTGHWPHWVRVDVLKPDDKWFYKAYLNSYGEDRLEDGTYEAIGPHFQGNPYNCSKDILVKHGVEVIDNLDRSFEGIKNYLTDHIIEGIVFWKDEEPQCKIKRSDFLLKWPVPVGKE